MKDFIPLLKPNFTQCDIDLVVEVLQSGMLVQGKHVEMLEREISLFTGTEFSMAVSSGTATLHLALKALGIGPGDEVIVPAFSYIATANVVELVGAKPVFVDIEISTFNIDADKIEEKITPQTRAVIPVHEFGLSCDIERIMETARRNNLFVVEDAACALGATQNNKSVGSFGDIGSFSFHPRKAITSGEGGIVTTNNENYCRIVKILRNHGIEYIKNKMEFVEAGFNYRMTDFQAALVSSQLKRLNHIIKYKNELADIYFDEISHSGITLPFIPEDRPHTWQTFHIMLSSEINRDNIILLLRERGIGSNYGAQCIPEQIYYKKKYGYNAKNDFPNAFTAYKQGIAIPLYDKLEKSDIKYIAQLLNQI